MKPDAKQMKVLQDYLQKTMNYRESYEEVYDHIISALETLPQDADFEEAINTIIKNDFGGHDNLLKIEQSIKTAMIAEAKRAYWACLKDILSFPSICYPLILGIILYRVLSTQNISPLALSFAGFAIIFTPPLLSFIRYYSIGYLFGDKGDTIKDESFRYLSYRPMFLFSAVTIYPHIWGITKFSVWDNIYPVATTLCLLIPLIYNMAMFKLYKKEMRLKGDK